MLHYASFSCLEYERWSQMEDHGGFFLWVELRELLMNFVAKCVSIVFFLIRFSSTSPYCPIVVSLGVICMWFLHRFRSLYWRLNLPALHRMSFRTISFRSLTSGACTSCPYHSVFICHSAPLRSFNSVPVPPRPTPISISLLFGCHAAPFRSFHSVPFPPRHPTPFPYCSTSDVIPHRFHLFFPMSCIYPVPWVWPYRTPRKVTRSGPRADVAAAARG